MGPEPVVLDISSDEEDATFDGSGKDSFDYEKSLDWLSKMLELEDEPWTSNDVVVVDELSCSAPVQKLYSAQLDAAKHVSLDDSDDDCKVLDGDPDMPVEVIQNEGNGSDELSIVGEKGQLACRDFPHSRHLCAAFPFTTTSHEKFCKLCHCFVCDIPAPCTYWGTGSSSDDHCHSSDKDEKWSQQRKALRRVNSAAENSGSLPVAMMSSRTPGMRSPSVRMTGVRTSGCNLPQTMASSSMHISQQSIPPQTSVSMHIGSRLLPAISSVPIPVSPASIPGQKSDSRPYTFSRCSATSFSTPNIISQRRNHQPGIIHSSHRRIHQLNRSRHFSGTGDIQTEWRGLSPQIISAHSKGRMAGSAFINATAKRPRTSTTSQNQVYSKKLQRSSCLPVPSMDENFKKWQDILLGRDAVPETGFQQCGVHPQPEMYAQSCTQSSAGTGMDLLSCSAPATSNMDFLNGGWLNAASVCATTQVRLVNSPLPDVQSTSPYAVPESNPLSGDVPLEEAVVSLVQEPRQETSGGQGLNELGPCTNDEQEILDSLLYI